MLSVATSVSGVHVPDFVERSVRRAGAWPPRSQLSLGFMPQTSLSVQPGQHRTRGVPLSLGFGPQTSLSGVPAGNVLFLGRPVSGVYALDFVERSVPCDPATTGLPVSGVWAPDFVERGGACRSLRTGWWTVSGVSPQTSLSVYNTFRQERGSCPVSGVWAPDFVERGIPQQ